MARGADQTGQTQPKRSGDFTDDGKPTKRTRVSRACDQCRASREKCDGSQPVCQSCVSQDRECSYNEAPKKRGIQPNYIRTLELALEYILEQFPDVRHNLCSDLPAQGHLHAILAGKDVDDAEKLHQSWRSSLFGRQIEQVLSGADVEHPSLRIALPAEHAAETSADKPVAEEILVLRLPENAWILLDFYFAYVHAWMPMTEKTDMMKLLYAYPPDGIPFAEATAAEHAELWSIMALSSHLIGLHANQDDAEGLRVHYLAEKLIPLGKTYEIPHLKAMILLTLIDMSNGRTLDGWLRIGTVVRILRLFTLLEENGTSRWCRHVHHAAFLVESALALRMNTSGHLTPDYIERVGLINEDGRDEWDPWQDPLAVSGDVQRAPARSFSTLNKLVSMHIRFLSTGMDDLMISGGSTDHNVIFDLLANASGAYGRLQPAVFLEKRRSTGTLKGAARAPTAEPPGHIWSTPTQSATQMPAAQGYSSSNMPNEQTHVPSAMLGPAAPDGPSLTEEGDIFQELAMLERADSSDQFMQNLGFDPDYDLQQFFGFLPDSDPMLQLGQPNTRFDAADTT